MIGLLGTGPALGVYGTPAALEGKAPGRAVGAEGGVDASAYMPEPEPSLLCGGQRDILGGHRGKGQIGGFEHIDRVNKLIAVPDDGHFEPREQVKWT